MNVCRKNSLKWQCFQGSGFDSEAAETPEYAMTWWSSPGLRAAAQVLVLTLCFHRSVTPLGWYQDGGWCLSADTKQHIHSGASMTTSAASPLPFISPVGLQSITQAKQCHFCSGSIHNSHSRATKKLPAFAKGPWSIHMGYKRVCVKGRVLCLFSSLWKRGIWGAFCCCVNDGRVHLFFLKGKKKNKHKTKPCLSCLWHWGPLVNITRLAFKVRHKHVY